MKHGSLFSGIGGFDLAAEWMGWENVFHCEWNKFGQKVLKHYWPNSISYGDITQTDFTIHRGNIDIISGGFPCQPYSTAGKRLGKEDVRHLWPEMLRAIREISPSYVVGENVYGLVNWNGGLVFDEVQADLESEGYEVQPVILPACGKNAPHKRERVWFIAYNTDAGIKSVRQKRENSVYGLIDVTNTINQRLQRNECRETQGERDREETFRPTTKQVEIPTWDKWPTKSPICRGNDGISNKLDGITFPKWRNESIKAYGNAIVPQVAHEIFKAISKSRFG